MNEPTVRGMTIHGFVAERTTAAVADALERDGHHAELDADWRTHGWRS
jgi:hypothetical protein